MNAVFGGLQGSFQKFIASKHPLIDDLSLVTADESWPRYKYALMMPADYTDKAGVQYKRYAHLGVKPTIAGAIESAIGEAVERYCAVIFPIEAFRAPFTAVEREAIPFNNLIVYGETQYNSGFIPFSRPTRTSDLSWVRAQCLTNGETCLVPKDFILLHNDAPEIIFPTSNGIAFHVSYEQAVLNGLLEVVERDARTLTWLARLSPTRIKADDSITRMLSPFEHLDRDFHLLDISLDIPMPCVVCISRDRQGRWPIWVASSACHLSPNKAIGAALAEHAQALVIITHLMSPERPREDERQGFHLWYAGSRLSDDEIDYLIHPGHEIEAEVWRAGYDSGSNVGAPVDLRSEAQLQRALCVMKELGYKVIVIDLTTEDVADYGFHVTRVLCPHLQPFHFGLQYRCLGTERLRHAMRLGKGLNPHPHPFA